MTETCYTFRHSMKSFVRAALVLVLVGLSAGAAVREVATRERHSTRSAFNSLPRTFLWAWERPENLEFIDTNNYGVAFLAKTLTLQGDKVLSKRRLQPLKVKEGTSLIAVVRVEVSRNTIPSLTNEQVNDVVNEVVEVSNLRDVKAVQIDFDATASQRDFYRQIILQTKTKLQTPLSITALASWCSGDNWLRTLPVDEAVPMFFRMGVEKRQFESRLKSGEQFLGEPCNESAGVSTDELVNLPDTNRVYIFNPDSWSQNSFNRAMEAYRR